MILRASKRGAAAAPWYSSPMARGWIVIVMAAAVSSFRGEAPKAVESVGKAADGTLVPTRQLLRPAGQSVEFGGRPVDLILSPDGKNVYVKDHRSILVLDAASLEIRQHLPFGDKEGGTMHGLALGRSGKVYATGTTNLLREAHIGGDGKLAWGKSIELKGANGKGNSYPCGVALSTDDRAACVCLSINNSLAIVVLNGGKLEVEIPVGVAPYGVVIS